MNTIAKLTITRSGYLIELTELGKHLSPGTYELTQMPAQGIDKETQTMKLLALVDDLIERDPDKAERFIESALARNALRKRLMEKKAAIEAPAQANTVDELIQMAKQCGHWSGQTVEMNDVGLERFAALASAAMLAKEAQQDKLAELALLCAEAYQVVGSLLCDVGAFDDDHAQKILDNLSQARRVHTDVLPWPTFTKPKDNT